MKKEVPKKETKKIEVIKKEEKTKKVVNNVKPVENKVNVTSIKKINISENDKYVIIATDGVWDTLDDDDVFQMSKNIDNSKDLCDNIVGKALDKGSMDNISCFVINLN